MSLHMDSRLAAGGEAGVLKVQSCVPQPPQAESREVKMSGCDAGHHMRGKGLQKLGLPDLLVLLEEFCAEDIPRLRSKPVLRLLSEVLEDATGPISEGAEDTPRELVHNADLAFCVSGIDWSQCCQKRLFRGAVKDREAYPTILTPETTFSLVFSILECALLAFTKIAFILESGPSLQRPVQNSGQHDCHCCDCEEPAFYNVDPEDHRRSEEIFRLVEEFHCHRNSRGDDPCCSNDGVESLPGLVGAFLRLIQCAVNCIGKEISNCSSAQGPNGHQSGNDMEMDLYWSSYFLENFLFGVGVHLKSTFPSTATVSSIYKEGVGENLYLEGPCECVPLHSFAGQTLLLFSDILLEEVQNGSPDDVLEEYFLVVESFVSLVLSLHARYRTGYAFSGGDMFVNDRHHDSTFRSPEASVHHNWCPHSKNERLRPALEVSTHWYIEQLVVRLRAMLEEMSAQKRRMPEFLLTFILKHISKEDGLHMVAEVVISFSRSPLDDSTNFCFSEGLVSDVLQVAFTNHSRSSSLSTLVCFMMDFPQNFPVVETSSQVSEISRHIWCYVKIAHGLTLAARLAASEHSAFLETGSNLLLCDFSIMAQGIGRVLAEGTAVAQWLLDLGRSLSATAWRELAVSRGPTERDLFSNEALENGGNFASCCSFLSWVDTMRMSVEYLVISGKLKGAEFTSWMEKGRIFVDQLLRLLGSETIPGFVKMSFVSFTKQQRPLRASDAEDYIVGSSLDADSRNQSLHCEDAVWDYEREQLAYAKAVKNVSDICQSEAAVLQEQVECVLTEQTEGCPVRVESLVTGSDAVTATDCVAVTTLTVETQQITKVTLTRLESKVTEDHATDAGNPMVAPMERKRWQIPTSVIVRRLRQKTRPSRRNNSCIPHFDKRICTRCREDRIGGASVNKFARMIWEHEDFEDDLDDENVDNIENCMYTSTNSYVEVHRTQERPKENFDDLNDFIVSKNGRDYSVWLKRRQSMRRRSYRKNYFKRLREKREFLLLLQGS